MQFKFIRNMTRICLKKIFSNNFSVSNKNTTKIKKLIIFQFLLLIDEKLITLDFQLINKNKSSLLIIKNKLTPLLIKKNDEIYFYEKIKIIKTLFNHIFKNFQFFYIYTNQTHRKKSLFF